MSAFLAVLGDSVRLLRARALFWVTLAISALVGLIYLSIGFDSQGITFLFGNFPLKNPLFVEGSTGAEVFYITLFTQYILGLWLTWIAIILALISCAPIFPEFMSEGAAGVTLCKPVSRVSLFLYKYVGGLLFVTLQAVLFTVIVVIAIRWRLGYWLPTIFWAIPLVTLVFSYLFSVQTLIGVKTKSVMLSILGTLLFWMVASVLETFHNFASVQSIQQVDHFAGGTKMDDESRANWRQVSRQTGMVNAFLPKMAATSGLLDRVVTLRNGRSVQSQKADSNDLAGDEAKVSAWMTPAAIIGTSLGFEAVVLGIAIWIFKRRDF